MSALSKPSEDPPQSKPSEYQPPEEVDAASSSSSSGDDSDDELSYDPTLLEDKQLGFHFVS